MILWKRRISSCLWRSLVYEDLFSVHSTQQIGFYPDVLYMLYYLTICCLWHIVFLFGFYLFIIFKVVSQWVTHLIIYWDIHVSMWNKDHLLSFKGSPLPYLVNMHNSQPVYNRCFTYSCQFWVVDCTGDGSGENDTVSRELVEETWEESMRLQAGESKVSYTESEKSKYHKFRGWSWHQSQGMVTSQSKMSWEVLPRTWRRNLEAGVWLGQEARK